MSGDTDGGDEGTLDTRLWSRDSPDGARQFACARRALDPVPAIPVTPGGGCGMKTSRVACVMSVLFAVSAACAPTAPPAPSESGKAGGQYIIDAIIRAWALSPSRL